VQWYRTERQRHKPAPGLRSADSVSAPLPPPLHHCAPRAKYRVRCFRFAGGSCSGNRTVQRPGNGSRCGRLRRWLCGGIKHNGVLCKARAPGIKATRPPGSHKTPLCLMPPQGQILSASGRAANGVDESSPLRFCCVVVPVCVFSSSCLYAVFFKATVHLN
jgi:hypothetical protein